MSRNLLSKCYGKLCNTFLLCFQPNLKHCNYKLCFGGSGQGWIRSILLNVMIFLLWAEVTILADVSESQTSVKVCWRYSNYAAVVYKPSDGELLCQHRLFIGKVIVSSGRAEEWMMDGRRGVNPTVCHSSPETPHNAVTSDPSPLSSYFIYKPFFPTFIVTNHPE